MDGLTRRAWLAGAMSTAAGLAVWRAGRAESLSVRVRPLDGIDSVRWEAAGELRILQVRDRERLTVEAEPAVLAQVAAEVHGRKLRIGFGPHRVQTRQPIRFTLEVRTLARLDTGASGAVHAGPLAVPALAVRLGGSEALSFDEVRARTLDVRLDGAGEIRIAGGEVERQTVVIAGAGRYLAPAMASRSADLAIEGSGDLQVAVSERLDVRIGGSGEVVYRGDPHVVKSIPGAGEVRREAKT
jgi:hypothetical protein